MSAVLFDEDFRTGSTGAPAGDALPVDRWAVRPGGDGVARRTAPGLLVVPEAVDPVSGHPAFTAAAASPMPRWSAFSRPDDTGSFGLTGPDGRRRLRVQAELAVTVHGPADSASAALLAVDRVAGAVFGLSLTGTSVSALYERLPSPSGADPFDLPRRVGDGVPGRMVRCALELDDTEVRFEVDGVVVRTEPSGGADRLLLGLATYAVEPRGQGLELTVGRFTVNGFDLASRSAEVPLSTLPSSRSVDDENGGRHDGG
ncbi:DUF6081 family protein [Streptacidiphilus jiangxiensis]|uniref:Uncharacterized protein n=1 Tax=Streptacidiphilus jiangxiensis TaxID=235985 RepID=A0A1H7JN95_STRJI|nr:DUF6081 family protein [Streptacidiphilus jiangxiensis]SEK75874.1 hypothetical protein SAMN05414137_103370 [Streptacidiphilus jiangxiensis]